MVVIFGIVGDIERRKVEQAAAAETVCEATRVEGGSGDDVEALNGAAEVVALDDLGGVVGGHGWRKGEERREQEKHAGQGPRRPDVDEHVCCDRRAARAGAGIIGGSRAGTRIDRRQWPVLDMAGAVVKSISS